MALSSAEKQRRYRERHLGIHGTKERIQLFISVQARAQLGRIAHHYGYAVTKVIEDLAANAERALLNKLPPRQRTAYLDGHHQHGSSHENDARRKGRPSKGGRSTSRPHRRVTA
jgi:hypothetical protein